MTAAFQTLSNAPTVDVVDEMMPVLEQYVTIMYDRISTCMKVNDARRDPFTCKGKDIETIPPTSYAFRQHAKRSTYQAGHCWGNSLVPSPPFPCPSEWGWVKVTNMWAPLWMTISPGIRELSVKTIIHYYQLSSRWSNGSKKLLIADDSLP